MKSVNIVYRNMDDLEKIRDDFQQYPAENILIQVFCGISDIKEVESLRSIVGTFFPGSAVIGASSGGEIINGEVAENSIIISVSSFEHTRVKSVLIEQNDDLEAAGESMGQAFGVGGTPNVVIVFGCGLKDGRYVNNFSFLNALNRELEGTVIAGGQAGGYDEMQSRVFVFTENGLTDRGFAGAYLWGTELCIHMAYNLSWVPIGKRMTITRAQGNRIYSIDQKSVRDIYQQYLGIEAMPSSLYLINQFPLMIKREGMTVTNPVGRVNRDGSFDFLHVFRTGEQVRFSFCDAGLQEEGALNLGHTISGYEPEAVFVYSCESRKALFGKDIQVDMAALTGCPSSAGFFTFGEHYTDSNFCSHFLQQTMTVLSISEALSCRQETANRPVYTELSDTDLRRFRILKALSHLVTSTAQELESKNAELAELADKDWLTGLANRRRFDAMLKVRLKEHRRSESPLSLILLDVDFFKQYNDRYGHVAGDNCLRGIAQVLSEEMRRSSDMAFRYGGEEFGVLLPFTDYRGAFNVAETIRSHVENLSIPHEGSQVNKYVTVSLGVLTLGNNPEMSPSKVLKYCDRLLYQAKDEGRDRVVGKKLMTNPEMPEGTEE